MVMPKKKSNQPKQILNRRAGFDYVLEKDLVVGLQLSGAEAKSLRMGHGNLRGAYVQIKNGELWLFNATITGNNAMYISPEDQTRSRKLLAKQKEIEALMVAKQQGRTIIPTKLLTGGRYIKVVIAVGLGKKKYDKREALKKRDQDRRIRIEH